MEGLREEMERCREWIEAALEHGGGTHDFDDIYEAVSSGYMQFWPADDACAVTEVITYPKKKVLHIFLAGGTLPGDVNSQRIFKWLTPFRRPPEGVRACDDRGSY